MKQDRAPVVQPGGGLAASKRALRKWKWEGPQLSAPVRCRKEEWYLLRAHGNGDGRPLDGRVGVRFLAGEDPLHGRTVQLSRGGDTPGSTLVGWVQAPADATHLQVQLLGETPELDRLMLYPAAERDPKCHPYANTPAWSTYKPPFPVGRIYVPDSLAALADLPDLPHLEVLKKPRSAAALARTVQRCGLILDRDLVRGLGLDYAGLLKVAGGAWVLVDLETTAELVRAAGLADARVTTLQAPHDIMSARVEYADVETRGFALLDVLPYSVVDQQGGFATRVLKANKSWKRFANDTGFATMLSSETPWESKCGDVLSAARALRQGELIASDLPWLVAGTYGSLLAPRLARHLLRMHLAGPIEEGLQYWNRWEDGGIVLRDIADLARRYPSVATLRWSGEGELASLGLAVGGTEEPRRTIVLRSGRMDNLDPHDGVPPEPMMILMKWLGRECSEQTPFARRHLATTQLVWQFETGDGVRQATHFRAAPAALAAPRQIRLRCGPVDDVVQTDPGNWMLPSDHGVHGDRSFEIQAALAARVRGVLKQA